MPVTKGKIYLAGSYNSDFRDKIINALPDHDFADPRKHRQYSIASLVTDDMAEAEESPIMIANFPKGKARGTMTYAEIGASRMAGNYIMISDENDEKDSLLEEIADEKFNSIDGIINFIGTNNKTLKSRYVKMPKKDNLNRIKTIFLATDSKKFPEIFKLKRKGVNILTPKSLADLKGFKNIDLNVVYFPNMGDWERKAIFFMGAAYYSQIPTVVADEKEFSYPPLNGLVRRIARTKDCLMDYLNRLIDKKSQDMANEPAVCYDLFAKYDGIDKEV